jgi:hypothetical protein
MMSQSNRKFSELRISQAYLKLLSIPENAEGCRMVSLERIGAFEIRIFESALTDSADGPLFWMELFNHHRQSSVDSCSCCEIGEAATAFDGFVSQTKRARQPSNGLNAPQS